LSAAGRFLAFRCKLPDRPGALATLLTELADLGANVLDVVHERVTPDLRAQCLHDKLAGTVVIRKRWLDQQAPSASR